MNIKKFFKYILPMFFWVCIFQIISFHIGNEVVLPNPYSILKSMMGSILDFNFWKIVLISVRNIFSATILAIFLGGFLGFISFKFYIFRWIINPFMNFIKTTPVAAITIILLVWIKAENISFNLVLMVVIPNIYFNVIFDLENMDKDIKEMIQIFYVSELYLLKKIYLKEIFLSIYRSLPIVMGFAWKSGISGEIIAQTSGTFGNIIYENKIYLEISSLFSNIFLLIIISYILEKTVIILLKKILNY